jgi:hypothetical protein
MMDLRRAGSARMALAAFFVYKTILLVHLYKVKIADAVVSRWEQRL